MAEIAGLALGVVDRDEYLKNNAHTGVSQQYTINEISVKYESIIYRSTECVSGAYPLTGALWIEGPTSAATVSKHKTFHMVGCDVYYNIMMVFENATGDCL